MTVSGVQQGWGRGPVGVQPGIVVNGCTGEVQGERPYSFWKIALFVLFIVAVVIILALVFGRQ